jgi:hypothetical protein
MEELDGVEGGAAGAVADLVATAGAGGGDRYVGGGGAHGGEQHELANLL